ncbi:esterase/lipase family protein [Pseudomonas simiae]|uniref:esterase/lipase family protein n=1 Tax=Pseudomonas simiae TaxID=321846 RepID=UPI0034E490F9
MAGTVAPVKANNVVLVHGSWADGSSWSEVITRLQAAGLHVTAVQNPLTSVADDVAATNRVLDQQDGATVLVGHSYAGTVVSDAGVNPNVSALVYVGRPGSRCQRRLRCTLGQVPDHACARRRRRSRRLPHPEPGRLPQVFRRRRAARQSHAAVCRAATHHQDAFQRPHRQCRLAHQAVLVRGVGKRPDYQPGPGALPCQTHERHHHRVAIKPLVAGIPRQGNHRPDPRSLGPPALSLALHTCHHPVGWLFGPPGYCELTAMTWQPTH